MSQIDQLDAWTLRGQYVAAANLSPVELERFKPFVKMVVWSLFNAWRGTKSGKMFGWIVKPLVEMWAGPEPARVDEQGPTGWPPKPPPDGNPFHFTPPDEAA